MKKKNISLLIYILLFLLIFIITFIYFDSKTTGSTIKDINNEDGDNFTVYNGYRIYNKNIAGVQLYAVEVFDSDKHRYLINFRYLPNQLEDIPVEPGIYDKVLYVDDNKDKYKSKIYISVNPNMTGQEVLSMFTLAQILWPGTQGHEGIYKIPVQTAYSADYDGEDFPIKDCNDATPQIGVILLKHGDIKIYTDDYCVIIQGNNLEELRKANEKLGYILLKVI